MLKKKEDQIDVKARFRGKTNGEADCLTEEKHRRSRLRGKTMELGTYEGSEN